MSQFRLSVKELEGKKVINFANDSSEFVEVIFTVDGKEVKEGKVPNQMTRGYGYTPKLEKPVKKMKSGLPLVIGRNAIIQAFIFPGIGSYKDADIDIPTFLRYKLVDKFSFRRTANEPIVMLETRC